jgi:hypothetical protein
MFPVEYRPDKDGKKYFLHQQTVRKTHAKSFKIEEQ